VIHADGADASNGLARPFWRAAIPFHHQTVQNAGADTLSGATSDTIHRADAASWRGPFKR